MVEIKETEEFVTTQVRELTRATPFQARTSELGPCVLELRQTLRSRSLSKHTNTAAVASWQVGLLGH